jgi:hypothetical protein
MCMRGKMALPWGVTENWFFFPLYAPKNNNKIHKLIAVKNASQEIEVAGDVRLQGVHKWRGDGWGELRRRLCRGSWHTGAGWRGLATTLGSWRTGDDRARMAVHGGGMGGGRRWGAKSIAGWGQRPPWRPMVEGTHGLWGSMEATVASHRWGLHGGSEAEWVGEGRGCRIYSRRPVATTLEPMVEGIRGASYSP